jgi:hypothetical protein
MRGGNSSRNLFLYFIDNSEAISAIETKEYLKAINPLAHGKKFEIDSALRSSPIDRLKKITEDIQLMENVYGTRKDRQRNAKIMNIAINSEIDKKLGLNKRSNKKSIRRLTKYEKDFNRRLENSIDVPLKQSLKDNLLKEKTLFREEKNISKSRMMRLVYDHLKEVVNSQLKEVVDSVIREENIEEYDDDSSQSEESTVEESQVEDEDQNSDDSPDDDSSEIIFSDESDHDIKKMEVKEAKYDEDESQDFERRKRKIIPKKGNEGKYDKKKLKI